MKRSTCPEHPYLLRRGAFSLQNLPQKHIRGTCVRGCTVHQVLNVLNEPNTIPYLVLITECCTTEAVFRFGTANISVSVPKDVSTTTTRARQRTLVTEFSEELILRTHGVSACGVAADVKRSSLSTRFFDCKLAWSCSLSTMGGSASGEV